MISATAQAVASAAATTTSTGIVLTTSNGMVLISPSTMSPRFLKRPTRQLVPSMLSELSFDHEVPHPDLNMMKRRNKERAAAGENSSKENSSKENYDESSSSSLFSMWSWNGLLCFSSGDPDLYFDAEEKLPLSTEEMDSDGKIIVIKTTVSTSELSELSAKSEESVEVKLGKGDSVVTTVCELRGGQQYESHRCQSSSPQHNEHHMPAAFDHPSRIPEGKPNPNQSCHNPFTRVHAPPAPQELPIRFLRAGKGDPIEGQRRYEATLQWRKEYDVDNILFEAYPLFEMIKKNYPHYYHLRGKQGEPVFFELPPKTNMTALKAGGIDLLRLVRHYTMVTEFQWQFVERGDFTQSITVLDLEGMRMMDFAGEVIEYVKMCSQFSGQHYPERAGHVIVVNVPRWFAMIWKVIKPMVDEVTLRKISIVRGKDAVFAALAEKIPVQNIPPEYGGTSVPLGESPEEHALRDLMRHNNALANRDFRCGGKAVNPACKFCSWGPVRSY